MKLYQSVTIPIDGVDESGRGTAFYGGKHFAVPFAFPGDVVRALAWLGPEKAGEAIRMLRLS